MECTPLKSCALKHYKLRISHTLLAVYTVTVTCLEVFHPWFDPCKLTIFSNTIHTATIYRPTARNDETHRYLRIICHHTHKCKPSSQHLCNICHCARTYRTEYTSAIPHVDKIRHVTSIVCNYTVTQCETITLPLRHINHCWHMVS